MYTYYDDHLSAEKLVKVYEIATPRVEQYLRAEIGHVLERIEGADTVLELGCGYGRVLPQLAAKAQVVVGIDTSVGSLLKGKEYLARASRYHLLCMDAANLAFRNHSFDGVVCIQNGISAFHVDRRLLVLEAIRVTTPGGVVMFSTYSDRFWEDRLEWFRLQSEAGLLGEIDHGKTERGVIVCKDGFTATTVSPDEFRALTQDLDADVRLVEVDQSSLFCEIVPH
jgi:2-polyprenyl-6-hydroxyphenyl methylase/3-demethylubiquinone-9 3-methyltransferase